MVPNDHNVRIILDMSDILDTTIVGHGFNPYPDHKIGLKIIFRNDFI